MMTTHRRLVCACICPPAGGCLAGLAGLAGLANCPGCSCIIIRLARPRRRRGTQTRRRLGLVRQADRPAVGRGGTRRAAAADIVSISIRRGHLCLLVDDGGRLASCALFARQAGTYQSAATLGTSLFIAWLLPLSRRVGYDVM